MAREHKGTQTKSFPHEYICIDVETTGVNPYIDRIIEVSAIHVKNRRIHAEFTSLVQLSQRHSIPQSVQKLTGITGEMLCSAPSSNEVMLNFHQFISNFPLVGHNVNFDINFLYDACERAGLLLENNYIDTLQIAKTFLPHLAHYKLSDLADYFGIKQDNAHRSGSDVIVTAKCFERMRSLSWRIENVDEYWQERMIDNVKRAKKYGKHTWELTEEDTL